jgi:hypothetical protein
MDDVRYPSRSVSESKGFSDSEALSRRTSLGTVERVENRQFTDQNPSLYPSMKQVVKRDEELKEIFLDLKLARDIKLSRDFGRVDTDEALGLSRTWRCS